MKNSTQNNFLNLLQGYLGQNLTDTELEEFFDLLGRSENQSLLGDKFVQDLNQDRIRGLTSKAQLMEAYEKLSPQLQAKPAIVRSMFSFSRIAAAAVIILLLSVGGYLYFNRDTTQKQIATTESKQIKNDVAAPQRNKAVLTLSDGSTIVLDSAGNGSLAVQGNVNVVKTADGQIVYKGDATEVSYNTLTVPRGSKPIQLQLADGSNVWLNVASSITYPTAFIGNERKVVITGEAYFEITHNPAKTFIVTKGETSVQVLGTHFNVNAYDDEKNIKVTLLHGSVKVNKGTSTSLLKPGQQAQVANEVTVVNNINIDQVMAWKNGLFSFTSADIQTVMRQLARWYDVEVSYQGTISKDKFTGEIDRNITLQRLLENLAKTRIHFRIEDGKKIVILP